MLQCNIGNYLIKRQSERYIEMVVIQCYLEYKIIKFLNFM